MRSLTAGGFALTALLLAKPQAATADPLSPAEELATRKVAKGFTVQLVASEPSIVDPVAMCFDEKGRLFIAETYRYRTSVLDIRDYMGMLELDLASLTIEDRAALRGDAEVLDADQLAGLVQPIEPGARVDIGRREVVVGVGLERRHPRIGLVADQGLAGALPVRGRRVPRSAGEFVPDGGEENRPARAG